MRGAGAVLVVLAAAGCAPEAPGRPERPDSIELASMMGAPAPPGFERALEPRELVFPADHGPHPGFQTEWWYVTGHLEAAEDRRFGFQLTFFRSALSPSDPESPSAWATRQVYMGHFALGELDRGRFHAFERFSRGALDLAGARAEPFEVWLGDWSLRAEGSSTFPMRLVAEREGLALDLVLRPDKPVVLQGEAGLSRKGSRPGNASYYYSLTRLEARGTVGVAGESFEVAGAAWMDREWSTSALEPGQVGWDWFSLQLDDGRDLMLYRMRGADGSADPASSGLIVAADGGYRPLTLAEFEIEELATWTSPESGARYPARWRLRVPAEGLDLTLEPELADQELRLTFRYWEGAVSVGGSHAGQGFVELTGY